MEIRTFVIMCNDVPEMVYVEKGVQGNGTYPKEELINLINQLRNERMQQETTMSRETYYQVYHWRWYPMKTTIGKLGCIHCGSELLLRPSTNHGLTESLIAVCSVCGKANN